MLIVILDNSTTAMTGQEPTPVYTEVTKGSEATFNPTCFMNTEDLRPERYGNSRIGIITSGSSYNQVYDAIFSLGIEVNVLKLGLTNPIPQEITMKFLKENDMILIAEELDPYLETKVRTYKDILGLTTEIHGKIDRYMPWSYEMNPHKVMNALRKMTGEEEKEISSPRPASRPDFCPGCPHRSTFYVVKRALKLAGKTETVLSSDIGCYSLSYYDPYQAADIMLNCGAVEIIYTVPAKAAFISKYGIFFPFCLGLSINKGAFSPGNYH